MIWSTSGELRFVSFKSLNNLGVLNRVFTRQGGVSPTPWASLNLGGTNGDSRENVIENRKRIFASIERPPESIFDVWQVHGNQVVCATEPRPLNAEHQKADIILTNNPQITLFMRFADCVPVLLCDPVCKVVGIVHAGWKGTVNKVAAVAIEKMRETYSTNPKDVIAVIGPSIGPDHYEVGKEVVLRAKETFGRFENDIIIMRNSKAYLDLWRANEITLLSMGVEKIEIAQECTACDTNNWYSHRGEKGLTGRFAALIAL